MAIKPSSILLNISPALDHIKIYCCFYPYVPRAFKDGMDYFFYFFFLWNQVFCQMGSSKVVRYLWYFIGFICYHVWGDELEVVFQLYFCCWQFGNLRLWKDSWEDRSSFFARGSENARGRYCAYFWWLHWQTGRLTIEYTEHFRGDGRALSWYFQEIY